MADIDDQEAVITIKVKLISDVEGDPTSGGGNKGGKGSSTSDDFDQEVSDAIDQEVKSTVDELVEEALKEKFGIDPDSVKKMSDMVKDVDSKGIHNITSMAKNPSGFMETTLIRVLGRAGPYGVLIAAIITAIIGAPELVKAIIEMLGVKGGPLNQDFRYSMDEQENQQFSRMVQYSRLVGDDPVITVTTKGFVVGDADFNFNTLLDANIARTARIGLRDSALGVIDGI